MRNIDMNRRQAWLIEYVRNHPGATKQEILKAWTKTSVSEFGELTYKKSTFWKDIALIRYGYGYNIEKGDDDDALQWGFYLKNDKYIENFGLQRWMLNVMQTGLLENTFRDLCHQILPEKYPCIDGILQPVCNALRDQKKLHILYHCYGHDAQHRTFAPYCIKAYKHRLYVFGSFGWKTPVAFSFDRIEAIEVTDKAYQMPPDFDAAEYFKHFYGVYTNIEGLEVTRIGIRAHDDAQHYLRDVPFHATQQEIYSCDDYADFEIEIYPTRDFIGDILQQCDRLEVLYPLSVRKMVAEAYHAGSQRYVDEH